VADELLQQVAKRLRRTDARTPLAARLSAELNLSSSSRAVVEGAKQFGARANQVLEVLRQTDYHRRA